MYVWLCIKETGWGSPKGVFDRGGGFHSPPVAPKESIVVTNRVKRCARALLVVDTTQNFKDSKQNKPIERSKKPEREGPQPNT